MPAASCGALGKSRESIADGERTEGTDTTNAPAPSAASVVARAGADYAALCRSSRGSGLGGADRNDEDRRALVRAESSSGAAGLKMAILSDWELWACANECIRQHGSHAAVHAALRADELDAEGEVEGAQNWRLIVDRVQRLAARSASAVQ